MPEGFGRTLSLKKLTQEKDFTCSSPSRFRNSRGRDHQEAGWFRADLLHFTFPNRTLEAKNPEADLVWWVPTNVGSRVKVRWQLNSRLLGRLLFRLSSIQ